jgi:hypothetical protein
MRSTSTANDVRHDLFGTPTRRAPRKEPQMRSIRVTLAAVAVVIATALAGCSASGGPSERQTTSTTVSATAAVPEITAAPAIDIAAPTVGQCWTLPDTTFGNAWYTWAGGPAVDCAAVHTAVTLGVAAFSAEEAYPVADVAYSGPVRAVVDSVCYPPSVDKQIVGTRVYRYIYFPTAEQWAAGARWARCDLSILALGTTAGTALAPLTQSRDEILAAAHTSYQKCLTQPGDAAKVGPARSSTDSTWVDCAGVYTWKFADGWKMTEAAYPGEKETKATEQQVCNSVRDVLHGKYAAVSWPTQADWDAGNRSVQCWISYLG